MKRWVFAGIGLALFALLAVIGVASAVSSRPGRSPVASAAAAKPCATPDVPSRRNKANPLALAKRPPAGAPLSGAHFTVDGPRKGPAAKAIVEMLGMNPDTFPDSYSWAQFRRTYGSRFNSRERNLAKIAAEESTQNVSLYAHGGGRAGIFAQTHKLLCVNALADPAPRKVMVFTTLFIAPNGKYCTTLAPLRAWQPTFKGLVEGMASAIASKRAVILEEIDAIGSICVKGQARKLWLEDLKFETKRFSRLPHAVVYAEGGYSDARGPAGTAKDLWQAGVNLVQGFWTNGTHFAWSINEIKWANKVSNDLFSLYKRRYRAHFIVNSAQNGQGPLRNPNPAKQGNTNLCNPPGRGLGRKPTGNVRPTTWDGLRFNHLDGFLWTGVPGRSARSNCPRGPWAASGHFDPRFAGELGQKANEKLGPGYKSRPY